MGVMVSGLYRTRALRFEDCRTVGCLAIVLTAQRMISGGAGLQFKGDGLYLTDYVHKNRKGDGEKAESTSKKTESSSSTKTESSTKAASSSDD